MLSRTLSKPLSACRNYRMLADVMFSFLQQQLLPQAILVFYPPSVTQCFECLFKLGQPLEVTHYPDDFWTWAAQFDSSDSLIPFATNPCQWNYKQLIAEETYLFTLDNHNERRAYLVLEGVNEQRVAQMMAAGELECLHLLAARWQCIRAETDAATEFKLRDRREAKYRDEITAREAFIENMKRVHQLAITLSNPENLDALHRAAVEAVRDKLGVDRVAFFLLDMKKRCFNGTYGTNEQGVTISEHHSQYDLHQLEARYIEAISDGHSTLVIVDDAPLYTDGAVVGQGWNGMLLLRDGEEVFGWLAMDNFIHRQPISDYQKQMLESFSSLLAQIYLRKRQEQNIRILHASMVELSRCLTVSDVCKTAVAFAIKRMGIDRMAVFLTDEKCHTLQGTWGTDIQGNIVDERYFRTSAQDNEIVLLAKASPNEVVFKESAPIYHDNNIVGFGWTAMTMLTDNDVPLAFISVDNLIRRSPLTSQLREVIRMFASNLTEVLMRAKAQQAINELNANLEKEIYNRTRELQKANEKLERLAKMDPLTRLGNRRMLTHLLEQICEQYDVQPVDYGVILLDIDHFGLFNNHYGHLEGDIALMRIGKILSQHTQSDGEQFCRIGGEEFVLLLVGHSAQKVHQLAESIRAAVEQESIPHCASPDGSWLTISVGYCVANFPASEIQFERMYAQADKALYQAKHQGRNRVIGETLLTSSALDAACLPISNQPDR
ncbi:diguanylate cyclase [Vibrio sp. V27_P1S3P104]|uniref:sensor domain-containing diguanylate cyclase n=1 Tax=unclassified Vibrio TaxID=2614977 RepID=UPI00137242AE|nr:MULTISPECIES: diguanylate cyclase [unclassified Vibrio]NAW69483.1 diguanylate cyclase [Vibrio sp. V28_P6S34P95]NAX06433.1 diguanylate cyclase [Vibrio sp. V30_P3S12P165]NAX34687.1 diguanylate cyclase [Vibrio sp. V29_P1S30P107]NAX38947.1 diguanylate cyclase [Vibrio sp. V27_P1S3P104]NAX41855.1 diguanylate cyclase [Vibrio sp. V26_P1S5P106]